jgi:hypothetical protein
MVTSLAMLDFIISTDIISYIAFAVISQLQYITGICNATFRMFVDVHQTTNIITTEPPLTPEITTVKEEFTITDHKNPEKDDCDSCEANKKLF